MIFDSTFKKKFIEYIQTRARVNDGEGSYIFKTIYNLIQANKLVFNTNVTLLSFDKGQGERALDAINHAGQSFGVLKGKVIGESYNYLDENIVGKAIGKIKELSQREPTPQDMKYVRKTAVAIGTAGALGMGALTKLLRKPFEFRFDADIKLEGGYDTFRKQLLFKVWLYAGYNIINNRFKPLLDATFSKILSACLYEGIFFYDYLNNGVLLQNQIVKDWYKTYFTVTCMQFTNRTTAAKIFGNILGELWANVLFNKVEKYILLNKQPSFIEKMVTGRTKSFISPDETIQETLNDEIFGAAIKELNNIDLDNDTREELFKYLAALKEFFLFMYKNRSQKLKPEFIAKELTTDMSKLDSRLLGFKIFGEAKNFDEAYKVIGLKKVYENGQAQFFKKNLIYSELYMPTTILAKRMYFSVLANNLESFDIQLLDYALRGLSNIDKI